jgi:hypothetical protein
MRRSFLFLALAATFLMLGTSSRAQAWGAYHVGYTQVGYGGIYHYGRTVGVGPYGAYYGGRDLGYGAYGGLPRYGGYRAYSPYYSGGYALGGYNYGIYYRAGVYRAW